jgi:GNAT superfamily N-acetyltransferase
METLSGNPMCAIASSDSEVLECLAVLQELRPHLCRETFLEQIRRQEQHGYALMMLRVAGTVVGVAGFRISECLGCGAYMYVDDFVVRAESRRQGRGESLLQELIDYARSKKCKYLMLDSAMHREPSHALYRKLGMSESCRHFELELA